MLKSRYIQSGIMVLLIIIALVPIAAPEIPFLRRSVDFSVQLMLAYLFLGLGFLLINNRKLLFTSFACCGALCLFLKQSSNSHLRLPESVTDEKVTIAHFNTSSAPFGYASLLEAVLDTDADIVSFQEVTPDWNVYLKNNLEHEYPFNGSNVRIDPYGMAVFSRFPINAIDTFHFQEIPHQVINVPVSDKNNINIISAHVLPPVGQRLNERAKQHLEKIANKISLHNDPSIVLGDFNLVYWSNEIRSFREKADLNNSRRDVSQNLLKIPYDHIFFTDQLECTNFSDISDTISNHLGIVGTYQFKTVGELDRNSRFRLF